MSRLTQPGATAPLDLFQTNSNPGGTYNYVDGAYDTYVGQRFTSSDNRTFVLVQNGGTALVSGTLICGPVSVANHTNLVTTAFTAASANGNQPAQVTVTLGGTAILANAYAGGYAVVSAGTGIGQTLKIASHPAQTSTTGNVVITLEDNPGLALDTTSTINLILNPYGSANGTTITTNGVVVASTTAASRGQIAGVAMYPIPASTSTFASYGLIQRAGLVACLNDANTTKGVDLMPSSNTAGAVMTYVVATSSRIGTSTETGTTVKAGLIDLQLS